ASAEAMKAKMAAFDVDVDDAAAMTAQLAFAQDKYDEIERLASKLIGLDRDNAHALYKVLRNFDDRCDLMRALAEGLGLDDDTVRRQPKVTPCAQASSGAPAALSFPCASSASPAPLAFAICALCSSACFGSTASPASTRVRKRSRSSGNSQPRSRTPATAIPIPTMQFRS